MIIANISIAGLSSYDEGGLIYYLYKGIELGIYPPMIFICIGAMTDFSPLISSPKTALIGLGGQVGIFAAMFGALGIGSVISHFIPGFETLPYRKRQLSE
uniref:sodium ion-translocating decarboxylase subunit beta n=1 Tax=Clostridium sp. NkU-1 TaxID=1095009 RepID=UPI000ACD48CB